MKPVELAVPFISNTPDDKQCLQAAYGMIRSYFEPEIQISWDEWARVTGYLPGKGTWSMAGMMWFKERGYEVVHIAKFDYTDLALRGAEYLIEQLGPEVADWKLRYMDLELERSRSLHFTRKDIWIKRRPTIADIYSFLNQGYLIKCLVNLNTLNGRPGYLGHAVVVKGYDETGLIMHDPGLPAIPNRHVPLATFLDAWECEGPQSEHFDAFRKGPAAGRIQQHFGQSATRRRLTTQDVVAV